MKNIYFLLSASLFFVSCGPTTVVVQSDSYQAPAPAPAPVEDVSYQSFYDQLSPYGNWINYPGYGYVWMPDAGPDFTPYSTNGNWIYSDAGWTWSSNYSWGWAPFHYGRWFYENGYGWMWVPGNEWAPAWVSWRGSGDYYGWAPLSPGVSVDVALNSYRPPTNYWNFVPRQYMGNPGWHNYNVNVNQNVTIINNTTIINNYSGTNRERYAYAPGPDPNEVRRVSGNNFATVRISETNTPGERVSGSQYMIYHPRVNAALPAANVNATGRPLAPAPVRYQAFSEIRPSARYQSNNSTQPVAPQTVKPATEPTQSQRPTGQNNPSNTQPAYFQRPTVQNNQGQAVQPVNNSKPAVQNAQVQPAQPARPTTVSTPPNANHAGQPSSAPTGTTQQVVTNHQPLTGQPAVSNDPSNVRPGQKAHKPKTKPADKPVEKPKPQPSNG